MGTQLFKIIVFLLWRNDLFYFIDWMINHVGSVVSELVENVEIILNMKYGYGWDYGNRHKMLVTVRLVVYCLYFVVCWKKTLGT